MVFCTNMRATKTELTDRTQSGRAMYESAKYYKDLGQYLDTSLNQMFNFVRSIPYKEDDIKTELVARPKYLIRKRFLNGLDCKKKAVLMGAWCNAHNIPFNFVAVSERDDKVIHHVFVQGFIDNEWRNIDPTYSNYKLFEPKPSTTAGEVLPR